MKKPDAFDLLAPIYDMVFGRPMSGPLLERLCLPTSGVILDAGGGTGRHAQAWVNLADRVLVADASRPMLRRARVKPGLWTVACLAERLPLTQGCIARIVMVDAFHHLIDQRASIAELWRVLTPGGRIVIEEPDIRRGAVRWVARFERWARMRSQFLPAETIAALLAEQGAIVHVERQGLSAWVIADKPSGPPLDQSPHSP